MINIMELEKSDLSLYLVLLKELDEENNLTLHDSEELLKKTRQYPFYKVYKMVLDEIMVGTFSLLICDSFSHGGKRFAIVENVVVHPNFHRRGIGKEMMRKAIEIAGLNNCYKLMLSSNEKRKEAHAFYEALGFQKHGVSYQTEVIQND
ncbi:GNAT family N-acetyltransferase [Halalkalibacter suaedae]|uniref:GNAT family N-acetyltransferase n=1 Tax=Halalkalibacter suaedae TaxID=2822140 RepID=A0A940WXW1_9BACI|nr:GNAT family N-acetyltransferase [Bacillus suaedae]MBP3952702.1 GNAT family N-acetyltransferase [Bacillus suaedae]